MKLELGLPMPCYASQAAGLARLRNKLICACEQRDKAFAHNAVLEYVDDALGALSTGVAKGALILALQSRST